MNYEDHVAAARTFLNAAEILSGLGMGMAAAEMVWGAANQAIHAANHCNGRKSQKAEPSARVFVGIRIYWISLRPACAFRHNLKVDNTSADERLPFEDALVSRILKIL